MKNIAPILVIIVLHAHATIASASRTLEHQAVIAAPVADVWNAWTTNEGFTSWAVAKAEIDWRIGGDMRTSYNPQSNLNDEHTIVNRILSFEPMRMLSIRNVQAPAAFKNAAMFQDTWTVVYLDPIGDDRTRVRIIGMGYGEGPEWDAIYNMFNAGNQWTLDRLRDKFAGQEHGKSDAADAADVLQLLQQMVGGHWVHESTREDGTVFRACHTTEFGPDKVSLIAHGFLGDATGMTPHAAMQIWREPAAANGGSPGPVKFQSINEKGDIARGEIHATGDRQIEWGWHVTEQTGHTIRYRITTRFEDADHYRFILHLPVQDGVSEERELVNIVYARVASLPQGFEPRK